MDRIGREQIEHDAMQVWRQNDRGDYLAPHVTNYPHAWLWDSAFHAIGMRHVDTGRAANELISIFDGQWPNGMLPNVRMYHPTGSGRFEALLWASQRASTQLATSAISQPPVIAEATQLVGESLDRSTCEELYRAMLPRLEAYHNWIYRERNPRGDGLFAAVHPWETGMDNSPSAMAYARGLNWRGESLLRPIAKLSHYLRRDLHYLDADERSSREEGELQAVALASLLRTRFDPYKLRATHRFHLQDVGVNSLLMRNNTKLREMADEIDYQLPDELQANMQLTQQNLEQLWDERDGVYYSRDALTGESVRVPTFASMLPLVTDTVDDTRGERMVAQLTDADTFWSPHGIANAPLDWPGRRDNGYWQEVWMNTNWLAYRALRERRYDDHANELRCRSLATVATHGMHEYFNARTGRGLGVNHFGWTAMLALDMLHDK